MLLARHLVDLEQFLCGKKSNINKFIIVSPAVHWNAVSTISQICHIEFDPYFILLIKKQMKHERCLGPTL